jgi:hypothetical protein
LIGLGYLNQGSCLKHNMEKKKHKLNLNDLKVNSFVTTIKEGEKQTIQGEAGSWWISDCFFTLTCGVSRIVDDLSGTWTRAAFVQLCAATARDASIPGICPTCAQKQPPAQQ